MGYSKIYSFFCNKTPAIVCSEEKENIIKCLVKYGLINIGDLVKTFLISAKDCLDSVVHLIPLSFLNILVMYFISSAKFVMNLLKKLTLPRNDCTFFLLLVMSIIWITTTLLGSNPYSFYGNNMTKDLPFSHSDIRLLAIQ